MGILVGIILGISFNIIIRLALKKEMNLKKKILIWLLCFIGMIALAFIILVVVPIFLEHTKQILSAL